MAYMASVRRGSLVASGAQGVEGSKGSHEQFWLCVGSSGTPRAPCGRGCGWCAVLDAKIAKPRLTLSAGGCLQELCRAPGRGCGQKYDAAQRLERSAEGCEWSVRRLSRGESHDRDILSVLSVFSVSHLSLLWPVFQSMRRQLLSTVPVPDRNLVPAGHQKKRTSQESQGSDGRIAEYAVQMKLALLSSGPAYTSRRVPLFLKVRHAKGGGP